jgi:G3E family GTPase
LYDVADTADESGQMSFRELLIDAPHASHDEDHVHAAAVTATSDGCVEPGALLDLLEEPPAGVYRLKGTVAVNYRARVRTYTVNVVGASVHIATASAAAHANTLVAIGTNLDVDAVRARVDAALTAHDGPASAAAVRRLQRHRRLSI